MSQTKKIRKQIEADSSTVRRPTSEALELALEELQEECAHVLHLMARLRGLPEGELRDKLEGELYAALVHLRHEVAQALKEWAKQTDRLPDE